MIIKYDTFILEKVIYDLIIESKLVLSKKLINLLKKIKEDKVADAILNLYGEDINDIKHNYLDLSDKKDKIMFTQDKKIQDFLKDNKQIWEVVESSRYLTHSDRNDSVFKKLGYDKTVNELWQPSVGTKGIIINETVRPSGKIYVLFQENVSSNPRVSVLNKEAIREIDENDRIWSLNRTEISVGRLFNAILKAANLNFTNKEIEKFVNSYKATHDIMSNRLSQFKIIKGDDIAYWYNIDRYESGGGTLNNSCMAEVDEEYFDIYTQNQQVNLVILHSDDSENTIKGRAILWDAEIDGSKEKFMDRIYTTHDSDVDLFKEFAVKNGFWYKTLQNMDQDCSITDGNTTKNATIKAFLDNTDFDYYPYMDTLSYLDLDNNTASNDDYNADRNARDTGGEWDEI
jgi:hypothetical protein